VAAAPCPMINVTHSIAVFATHRLHLLLLSVEA